VDGAVRWIGGGGGSAGGGGASGLALGAAQALAHLEVWDAVVGRCRLLLSNPR